MGATRLSRVGHPGKRYQPNVGIGKDKSLLLTYCVPLILPRPHGSHPQAIRVHDVPGVIIKDWVNKKGGFLI
eukprot:scaffold20854_cov126-Skeletonema_dohrnii-CCMP3373.AAC.5